MILGIFCAGALGKEVLDIVKKQKSQWDRIIFIDDCVESKMVNGIEVYTYSLVKEQFLKQELKIVVASGEPFYRNKIAAMVENDGFELTSIVSEQAYVGGQLYNQKRLYYISVCVCGKSCSNWEKCCYTCGS